MAVKAFAQEIKVTVVRDMEFELLGFGLLGVFGIGSFCWTLLVSG